MHYDYAADLYEQYFRGLIKDIAEKYPKSSKNTLKEEMDYIQKK